MIEEDKIRGGEFIMTENHETLLRIKNNYKISDEDWIDLVLAICRILR